MPTVQVWLLQSVHLPPPRQSVLLPLKVTMESCNVEASLCVKVDTRIVERCGIYLEDVILQPSLKGIAERVATNTLSLAQDMACGAFI